ncbi:MAG: hypothetical protein P1P89_16130 [Desulfobacterales bacterium]|nr:hypothetical protein [Desulfobacterales bacterium]
MSRKHLVLTVAMIILSVSTGLAQKIEQDAVVIVTQASYLIQPDDSTTLAKALAQYGAKRNAVETAGRYFVIKGLVESYEKKGKRSTAWRPTKLKQKYWKKNGFPPANSRDISSESSPGSIQLI